MITKLQTYGGLKLFNWFSIGIRRGVADIEQVMADVLAMSRLNYNACIFGDGVPVTLSLTFAESIALIRCVLTI